jgi:hypothetical protein
MTPTNPAKRVSATRRGFLLAVPAALALTATELDAQLGRRRRVARRTIRRTVIVLGPGHPIRRAVRRQVVLHPARVAVAIAAPLVFLPVVRFAAVNAALPPRDRLTWEDSETIDKDEEWVDSNFGVDKRGDALYLAVDGRAQLDFAEVTFENGNVQVVDFDEKTYGNGTYTLLDFADGRHVKTVRLLAKSKADETKFTVYMRA